MQQRISQLMADMDKRQDEYSEMVSGLTQSHEDQLQRQANHLSAVAEQRLAELNVSLFCLERANVIFFSCVVFIISVEIFVFIFFFYEL